VLLQIDMNEIDDMYKQESEDIDTNFLESIKDKKAKKNNWDNYLEQTKKSREKFEKKYTKYLEKEKWKIHHQKKKKEKKQKYDHLMVKHFNFEYNFFQRTMFSLNVFFFGIGRFFSRIWAKIVPKFLIYFFYKLIKTAKFHYKIFRDWLSLKKSNTKRKVKKFLVKTWNKLKENYAKASKFSKTVMGKIKFWKKGEEEEGEVEGEEKEGGDKKDESGDKKEEKSEEKKD
jgi:hypothetical protein